MRTMHFCELQDGEERGHTVYIMFTHRCFSAILINSSGNCPWLTIVSYLPLRDFLLSDDSKLLASTLLGQDKEEAG